MRASILEVLARHGVTPSVELGRELEALVRPTQPDSPLNAAARHAGALSVATWSDEVPARDRATPGTALPSRYRHLGELGTGGMGQVLEVHDAVLGRTVAMKIAHAELSAAARSRFLAEAQVVAQLQHPGIVPVYDLGVLGTGEPYFTMPIVHGRTLGELIRRLHDRTDGDATPGGSHARPDLHDSRGDADRTTLRRLLVAFHAAADAMGHAHTRGVVHRDLKPDNIMVGDHGATVIVDWGLAKVIGGAEPGSEATSGETRRVTTNRSSPDARGTLDGAVIGTLGYMPPEQARGELDRVDARADVHALGATLYEILSGAPPFTALDRFDALAEVIHDPAPRLAPQGLPPELVDLAHACLEKDPDARPPDAVAVAAAVEAWLEGTHRRERAMVEVETADLALGEISRLHTRADLLEADAAERLRAIAPHEGEERKREAWRLEDAARQARADADLLAVKRIDALGAALRTEPNLVEAHERLAAHFRAQHERSEADGDARRSAQLLHLVRSHDVRGRHTSYLDGAGRVTLITEPAGAQVHVFRYEVRDRRRVAVPFGRYGPTPMIDLRLPMGSYRFDVRLPGYEDVRYPVFLQRCARWDGVAPGEASARPLVLPPVGSFGPDDRYVPAGWFQLGGDPLAEWPRPLRWQWSEGFVIRQVHVTNRQFIAFLDDLVAHGREDDAERYVPRDAGRPVYGRTADGGYALVADPDGDVWHADYPAMLIDWGTAGAYAQWEAARTGLPWRLPRDHEWEKAARGVDGRKFPWGDFFDPSWCCVRASHVGRPLPEPVGTRIVDRSPYGVCDLGGNVHDWCEDAFAPGSDGEGDGSTAGRSVRGGAWHTGERWARAASRGVAEPHVREAVIGFRLSRAWPAPDPHAQGQAIGPSGSD